MRTLETEKGKVTINEAWMEMRPGYGRYSIRVIFTLTDYTSFTNPLDASIDTNNSELWDNLPDEANERIEYLLKEAFYSIMLAIEESIDNDLIF